MGPRIKGAWIAAGIAVLGAMIAGGSDAGAGTLSLSGSIVPLPGGSPFLYEFDLFLTGGTIVPDTAGRTEFTVGLAPHGLVGVTGQSGHQEPPLTGFSPEVWIVPSGGIVTTTTGNPPPYDQASSVQWQYFSGPTITWAGSDILLGLFTVQTTSSFPDNAPPVTPGITPIDWSYSVLNPDGSTTTGGGTITLAGVPEPSSVILLLVGSTALPLVFFRRRRRRRV
jgi:hypothetical protein